MDRSLLDFCSLALNRWFRFFILLGVHFALCSFVAEFSSAQEYPPTVRSEGSTGWNVEGTVVAESGIGIPNASVLQFYEHQYVPQVIESDPLGDRIECDWIECDRSGRFSRMTRPGFALLATAPGYAPNAIPGPSRSSVEMILEKGRTIRGKVLLPSGRPAKDVLVSPVIFHIPRGTTKEKTTALISSLHTPYVAAAFPDRGKDWATQTDAKGEFEIDRLPTNSRVGLSIYLTGYLEEVVFVRGDSDDRSANPSETILADDDFIHRLKPSSILRLKGVDAQTGRPAMIRSIGMKDNDGRWVTRLIRRPFDSATPSLSLRTYPGGLTVWVEPVDKLLLPYCFELPAVGETDVIDKTIEFRHGRTVKGIVKSAENGEPIKNVELRWRSRDGKQVSEDGDYVGRKIVTDEDGEFTVVVPQEAGVIGVVGNVDRNKQKNGFQYAPYWNKPDIYRGLEDVLNRHSRFIPANDEEPGDLEFVFKLLPAWTVEIKTVDPAGKPLSEAVVTAEFTRGIFGSQHSFSVDATTVESDDKGIASFVNWFDDEYRLRLFQKQASEAASEPPRSSISSLQGVYVRQSGMPGTVEAFALDGRLQGTTLLLVPADNSDLTERVVRVELALGWTAKVEGQIVDQNGNGIDDLSFTIVSLSSEYQSGQSWKTRTREDGRFRIVGVPIGGELGWSTDTSRVETFPTGLVIDTSALPVGGTLHLNPLRCYDFSMLAEPLPKLEINGLSDRAALVKIMGYLQSALARIPNTKDPALTVGNANRRPVLDFQSKLFDAVLPALKKLGDRNPGNDLELEMLTAIWEIESNEAIGSSLGATRAKQFVGEQLMKNQLRNEAAQPLLLEALKAGGYIFDMGSVLPKLTQSTFPKTRLRGAAYITIMQMEATSRYTRRSHKASKFDIECQKLAQSLEQFQKHSQGFDDAAKTERVLEKMEEIEERSKAYLNMPSDAPDNYLNLDSNRYKKMMELLHRYLGD